MEGSSQGPGQGGSHRGQVHRQRPDPLRSGQSRQDRNARWLQVGWSQREEGGEAHLLPAEAAKDQRDEVSGWFWIGAPINDPRN